jgi:hypothetical protein
LIHLQPQNVYLSRICFPVFVRRGKNKKAELVILDHGLYEQLAKRYEHNLLLFVALTLSLKTKYLALAPVLPHVNWALQRGA